MDAIDTGGGASAGNVGAGRDFVGRDRRSQQDSHDIIIRMDEAHKELHSKMLEMMVDIKFLQSLTQERGIRLAQMDSGLAALEKAVIDLNNRIWWMDKGVFLMSVVFIVFLISLWR